MALNFEIQNDRIILFGDTFSLKDQIKLMGGRWNSQEKRWSISHNEKNIESIKTLGFQSSLALETKNYLPISNLTSDSLSFINQPVPHQNSFMKISEFVQIINSVIRTHLNQLYWIYGEISSLKTANGHVFFDLIEKDENTIQPEMSFRAVRAASISCILWAGKKKFLQDKLNEIPFADGTQIKIKVGVDFRKEGARIVALVEDIDSEHTKGNLLLQRQSIVLELKKRNLYQKNKTTYLNAFPINIALITAENSRASADFIDELKLSKIAFQVTCFDCNMQGEKTSENIVTAFQQIANNHLLENGNPNNNKKFNCVVVTRGGGSKLDLRWFDDLEIAKQIALCRLPVITAVGHFDDISIADEISFRSEKTPTAAARYLSSKIHDSFIELFSRVDNIGRVILQKFAKERQILNLLEQKIILNAQRRLQSEAKNIERIEQFLKIFTTSLEKTMQRGFSLVYDANGKILTGLDFLQPNFPKELEIQFSVGEENEKKRIQVKVTTKEVTIT